MPDVTVDLLVSEGSLIQATNAQSIGTDGCTMCVGIVAVMQDLTKYCAHFDCASQGRKDQVAGIQANTLKALKDNIPGVPIAMSACTTANTNMSTGAIWNGIKEFFAATELNNTNGIYAQANGAIGTVTGSDQVLGAAAAENQIARIP